jgi:hypothetical protein
MYIIAFFMNNGAPATGLSATIRIRRVSDGVLLVTDHAMVEVGDGWYRYTYGSYDSSIDYAIRCDGGSTLLDEDRYAFAGNENYLSDIEDAILADGVAFNGASIAAILADTNELQGNQGDWATATGFSTFDAATDEVDIGSVKGVAVTGVDDFKASVSAINTLVQDIAKLTGNDVSLSGTVITIYEDDGVTVWRKYDLASGGRIRTL